MKHDQPEKNPLVCFIENPEIRFKEISEPSCNDFITLVV